MYFVFSFVLFRIYSFRDNQLKKQKKLLTTNVPTAVTNGGSRLFVQMLNPIIYFCKINGKNIKKIIHSRSRPGADTTAPIPMDMRPREFSKNNFDHHDLKEGRFCKYSAPLTPHAELRYPRCLARALSSCRQQ
jgi:hypothetical protein